MIHLQVLLPPPTSLQKRSAMPSWCQSCMLGRTPWCKAPTWPMAELILATSQSNKRE